MDSNKRKFLILYFSKTETTHLGTICHFNIMYVWVSGTNKIFINCHQIDS